MPSEWCLGYDDNSFPLLIRRKAVNKELAFPGGEDMCMCKCPDCEFRWRSRHRRKTGHHSSDDDPGFDDARLDIAWPIVDVEGKTSRISVAIHFVWRPRVSNMMK